MFDLYFGVSAQQINPRKQRVSNQQFNEKLPCHRFSQHSGLHVRAQQQLQHRCDKPSGPAEQGSPDGEAGSRNDVGQPSIEDSEGYLEPRLW